MSIPHTKFAFYFLLSRHLLCLSNLVKSAFHLQMHATSGGNGHIFLGKPFLGRGLEVYNIILIIEKNRVRH